MSMTLLEAETEIVEGLLHYLDWRGGDAPYSVDINTRREGHPRTYFGREVDYPLACVKLTQINMESPQGQQQPVTLEAVVYYVLPIEDYSYPDQEIRRNLGRIVENILQSNQLGRAWITDIVLERIEFENSDFEQFLRRHDLGFTSGEATFTIYCWYEL